MPNDKPITTPISGEALPENFPHQDDAKNAPNKPRKMSGNFRGHKAGKLPGGKR